MTNRSKQLQIRLLGTTIAASAIFAASPAFAQDNQPPQQTEPLTEQTLQQTQSDDTVVVTGTLIRNPNLVSSTPVNTVGEDEIDLQQANVAEELLRELPGAVPSIGSAVNNGNGGGSFVNLRGLGSNRNITLLDGVRIVPFDLIGRVDLNNIPLALIQRVDVLTGGASTTYGADAISGVVNFITRQDFAGVDVNLSNQITERGDGHVFRADVTVGANFDDGRGNAVFSVGYQEADPVYQGARDISINNIDSFTGTSGGGSGTTVPSRFFIPGLGNRQINPATGNFNPTSAFTAFNFNPFNIFQTPFERFNMYGAANYEISEAVEVYTRGLFSKNFVQTIIAPSGAFALPVTLPISNPFLPAGARNTFCSAFATSTADLNPFQPGVQGLNPANCAAAAAARSTTDPNYREIPTNLFRRTTEVGPRLGNFTTTVFDYRAGIRGDITESIEYDLFGSYGESENTFGQAGYTLNSRIRQSIRSTAPGVCIDPSNGCVPVNFFGPEGSITPEQVGFLTATSNVQTIVSLAQARGTISGDIGYTIPWASEPISFAVGGEFRENRAAQQSDLLSQSGDLGGAGGAAPNIDGGFDVWEAFGELILPIVSDQPFFHELTLEAGGRYSQYSVDAPGDPTFETFTWKLGGSWAPVESLRFRGVYAHSVRAPNINELFSPVNTVLTNLANDPCANRTDTGAPIPGRPVPTGVLRDVCIAQGAPASQIGLIAQPTAGQANTTVGGNLDLQPEDADSYTVGFVFTPDFVPNLSLSLDYYNIVVTGAITSPVPGDIIAACFDAPAVTNPACSQIRRNPADGSLSGDPTTTPGLIAQLTNQGRIETDGIDLVASYRQDLGFAALALSFVGNYTFNSKFQSDPASLNRECVGFYSVNCGSIQPEFSWSQRTTLTFGDTDISLLWRHIDAVEQEPQDIIDNGPAFRGNLTPVPGSVLTVPAGPYDFTQIDAYDYFDLTARWNVNDNFTFTFSIQNLLDNDPPLVGSTVGTTTFNSGNTYPSTYDTLGRRFVAAARLRF